MSYKLNKVLLHPYHRVKKTSVLVAMFYKVVYWKFCKIYRKTPVLESLFNKVADIKRVHHKCFPMKCFF